MLDGLKLWSLSIFLGKWAKRGLRVVIAAAASHIPATTGIQINQDLAFAAAWSGLEWAANYSKVKATGTRFGKILQWVF